VLLLSHCEIMNPSELFDLHWRKMSDHWLKKYPEQEARLICKAWIRRRVFANYGNVNDPLFDGVPDNQHIPSEGEERPEDPGTVVAKEAAKGINNRLIP
jgi:hypothetical protein